MTPLDEKREGFLKFCRKKWLALCEEFGDRSMVSQVFFSEINMGYSEYINEELNLGMVFSQRTGEFLGFQGREQDSPTYSFSGFHPEHGFSKQFRYFLAKKQGFRCAACRTRIRINKKSTKDFTADLAPSHVDHIIPVACGGFNHEDNLQVLCEKCNLRKGKNIVQSDTKEKPKE